MTVRELIELNQMITDIQITVRKNHKLLDQLNIGPDQGRKPPFPTRVPREERYINNIGRDNHTHRDAAYIDKSINAWDDGRDYWEVKVKRIPEAWLELEVFSWEVWPAGTLAPRRKCPSGVGTNVNFHGQRLNIEALASSQKLTVPEPKKKPDEDEQLEGQMSIEDWNYEVVTI